MALSIDERIDRLWLRIYGFACDEWKEEEHKRDKAGRFSKGSQSAMKSVKANITRGRNAMNTAITEKRTVHRAMYRNELGWIDFEWGDTGRIRPNGKTSGGMGLSHIIEARMRKDGLTYQNTVKMLVVDIVRVIAEGAETKRVYNEKQKETRLTLDHDNHEVILIKKKGNNGWVVSGDEKFSTDNNK